MEDTGLSDLNEEMRNQDRVPKKRVLTTEVYNNNTLYMYELTCNIVSMGPLKWYKKLIINQLDHSTNDRHKMHSQMG